MRRFGIALVLIAIGTAAYGQSIPYWMAPHTPPYVPTAQQWQAFAASKQDLLSGAPSISPAIVALLGINPNTNGGMVLLHGLPVNGNCLQWSATGIQDAGNPCGTGSGGGGGGPSGWNGALPTNVTGANSGGIAYFPSTTQLASSPPLALNQLMRGGGPGNPPNTFALTGGDVVFNGNNFTVNSIQGIPPGPLYTGTKVNLATQVTGNLPDANLDSGINADALHCLSGSPTAGSAWQSCSGTTFYALPGTPAGTSSASLVMMGLGTLNKITPKKGGNVMIAASGSIVNSSTGTCVYAMYYGIGTPPANGAAVPGTATHLGASITSPNSSVLAANGVGCFTSLGTTYWVDLAVSAVGTGTCTPSNISFSSIEN